MGEAAQGGGGVSIPGGVPEQWKCGTEGRGQWAWWGWVDGFDGLNGLFPTLVILQFCGLVLPFLCCDPEGVKHESQ